MAHSDPPRTGSKWPIKRRTRRRLVTGSCHAQGAVDLRSSISDQMLSVKSNTEELALDLNRPALSHRLLRGKHHLERVTASQPRHGRQPSVTFDQVAAPRPVGRRPVRVTFRDRQVPASLRHCSIPPAPSRRRASAARRPCPYSSIAGERFSAWWSQSSRLRSGCRRSRAARGQRRPTPRASVRPPQGVQGIATPTSTMTRLTDRRSSRGSVRL